jgi:hypothetical protein
MGENEGGDNRFLSGLLVGVLIGLVLGGGAGGVLLLRNSQEAEDNARMRELLVTEAEAMAQKRAEEREQARERIKELEAKLAEKKP